MTTSRARNGKGKSPSTAIGALGNLSSRQISALRSELIERYQFASRHGIGGAGTSFGGARDLYEAGGYPRKLTNAHYLDLYQRGDIAERLVEAYPKATWTPGASIFEDEDPDNITPWEITVNTLFDRLDIWGVFRRADILSRIGENGYSVILIGDKSRTPLDQELPTSTSFESLLYLQPIHQKNAKIAEFDEDLYSERFSLPRVYELDLGKLNKNSTANRKPKVHWSRLIHFTEGGLDNPVYGAPALRSIFNRLMDMEKIYTAGSEAAFKRMDPGAVFTPKEGAILGATDAEEEKAIEIAQDRIDEFYHSMRRYLMLDNLDVTPLQTAVHNFGGNIDSLIKAIAGAKGFPQRKLTGSEEAQLASEQDRSSYQEEIDTRQALIALPHVRTFVNRVNSDNPPEWDIYWPTRDELNDHEKAELVNTLAQANDAHYKASGELLYTGSEIRDKVGDGPMDEEQLSEIDQDREDSDVDSETESDPAVSANRSRSSRGLRSGRIATLRAAKRKHVEQKNLSRGVVLIDPSVRSLGNHSSPRSLAPADDRDEQTAVRRIADNSRSSFASMMIDLWSSALTDDDVESLRLALDNQDRAIEFVNLKIDDMEGRARTLLRDRYTSIVEKVGKASLRVVERRGSFSARRRVGNLKGGEQWAQLQSTRGNESRSLKLMDFSITNPRAIEWARTRSSALITEIGSSTRETVREIVTSGLRDGRAPRVIAKEIGSYVGLRSDQLETLRKFEAGGATEAQVARRGKQLLKHRAELISRTETMSASNHGLREMWNQAVDNDLLPADVNREWIATADDRTRDEHADLDGEQVGLNESFSLGFEPGQEPACRCSQGIV